MKLRITDAAISAGYESQQCASSPIVRIILEAALPHFEIDGTEEPVGYFNLPNGAHGYQQVAPEFAGKPGTVPLYARCQPASTAPIERLTPEQLQMLIKVNEDRFPIIERKTDALNMAFGLSDTGLLALAQHSVGVTLHITRLGRRMIEQALSADQSTNGGEAAISTKEVPAAATVGTDAIIAEVFRRNGVRPGSSFTHGACRGMMEAAIEVALSNLPDAAVQDEPERIRNTGIGMAIAAGIVMRVWGHSTEATEILNAAGYTSLQKLLDDGVDDYDIEALRPLFEHEGE